MQFEFLSECDERFFLNIKKILEILATLPVSTTTTAERTFSTLRHLKTYLRFSTDKDLISGLTFLSIQKEIDIDPN